MQIGEGNGNRKQCEAGQARWCELGARERSGSGVCCCLGSEGEGREMIQELRCRAEGHTAWESRAWDNKAVLKILLSPELA